MITVSDGVLAALDQYAAAYQYARATAAAFLVEHGLRQAIADRIIQLNPAPMTAADGHAIASHSVRQLLESLDKGDLDDAYLEDLAKDLEIDAALLRRIRDRLK
jgi:hypothetical protein